MIIKVMVFFQYIFGQIMKMYQFSLSHFSVLEQYKIQRLLINLNKNYRPINLTNNNCTLIASWKKQYEKQKQYDTMINIHKKLLF